jgi:serpin B
MVRRILALGAVLLFAGAAVTSAQERAPARKPAAKERSTPASKTVETGRAQLSLGVQLIQRRHRDHPDDTNIVVSPASLAMILAVVDLGADDKLRAGLHRSLAFAPARKAGQGKDLAALRETVRTLQGDPEVADALKIANAVFFDSAMRRTRTAEGKVQGAGAEIFVDDLSTPAAVQRINGWVAEKTDGLIPTILDRPPSEPGLIGLNALYFKDRWRTAFNPELTRPAPFLRADGSSVEVAMMHAGGSHRVRTDETFAAVELSYARERFALVLLTTVEKPAGPAAFAKAQDWLGGEGFTPSALDLVMPRFTLGEAAPCWRRSTGWD